MTKYFMIEDKWLLHDFPLHKVEGKRPKVYYYDLYYKEWRKVYDLEYAFSILEHEDTYISSGYDKKYRYCKGEAIKDISKEEADTWIGSRLLLEELKK